MENALRTIEISDKIILIPSAIPGVSDNGYHVASGEGGSLCR